MTRRDQREDEALEVLTEQDEIDVEGFEDDLRGHDARPLFEGGDVSGETSGERERNVRARA